MVIDGGIRDLDGIYELPDFATFVRGVDPTGIANVTLTGINIPNPHCRGDSFTGRRSFGKTWWNYLYSTTFRNNRVVEQGEEVALRDRFGHQRLREGILYTR